ncbi:MAG: ATP-binding cassette domain-containing protein [Planctomycetes bacterium]|nr:ATP-binding cassette domain-containing protein [Planctomycetota bacterium]
MTESVVELENVTVVRGGHTILSGLNWTIREGETWAVVGATGSGKTTLAEVIRGKQLITGEVRWPLIDRLRASGRRVNYPSQVIAHVSFKEESRLFSYAGHYYQQRFEFADSDEPLSLVQFLRHGTNATDAEIHAITDRLGVREQLTQPFMTLSNGQTRRSRLARALLAKPELLILDDPFIGLDTAGRADLTALLDELRREGKRLVLNCRADMVPPWVTHVWEGGGQKAEGGMEQSKPSPSSFPPSAFCPPPSAEVIDLRNVTVAYGEKRILDNVTWTVRAGERWAVVGPNGSGKTTLLSLLCGDHPQAYANDISLFGRRRGTGETIWDVKRNVGLVSPEFHLYFTEPLTADRTAATGFHDALADRPTTPEQDARVRELFAAFGIANLHGRLFRCLSVGEQRLVLLARALVKRPPLVILDEPFQGLDAARVETCRAWLDRELGDDQTLLFVTHELAELPRTVTQTLRLDRGRVG